MLTATKLYVTTVPLNQEYENPRWDTVPVYRFSNGAILVQSESEPDWFFDSMDDFEPNGNDVLESYTVSDETQEFAEEYLRDLVKQSIAYYDTNAGTSKILDLLEF